jgi:hypothetical protein
MAEGRTDRGMADLDLTALPPPRSPPAPADVDLEALPPPRPSEAVGTDRTAARPRRPVRVRSTRRVPVARIVARDRRRRRQARALGAAGFVLAAVLPALLFHRVILDIAREFRLDARYFLEWAPWVLLVLGLAFLLPVAYSAGLDPDSRHFPRFRRAYAGWGITLYLLGVALATQVAQLYALHH